MQEPRSVDIETGEPDDPRWHRFAMRICLGASVTEASARAGVSRALGYEWLHIAGVQRLIARYNQEAASRARRELAGLVRNAVRTVRAVMADGSAKGSPTRLEAAKLVLALAKIEVVPVASQERRIVTYMPRPGRDGGLTAPEDASPPEPAPARADLPVTPTADRLPPDFPRLPDGSVNLSDTVTYFPAPRRTTRDPPA